MCSFVFGLIPFILNIKPKEVRINNTLNVPESWNYKITNVIKNILYISILLLYKLLHSSFIFNFASSLVLITNN
jgi:hypothetical protein